MFLGKRRVFFAAFVFERQSVKEFASIVPAETSRLVKSSVLKPATTAWLAWFSWLAGLTRLKTLFYSKLTLMRPRLLC